jgi:hypothetical protein
MPVLRITRLGDQIIQAIASLRIITIVHFKRVQGTCKIRNLRSRGLLLRILRASGKFWNHQRCQNSQNGQHQQQFNQRETTLPPIGSIDSAFHNITLYFVI